MKLVAIVAATVIGATPVFAQEGDDQMTPAQVMELLKEAHRMMGLAEKLLHEESVEKAEKKEKDAARKLDEVIKKARSSAGQDSQKQQQKQDPAKSKPRRPGDPAPTTYDPNRSDPPSVFKSRGDSGSWGHLPPAVRDAMRAASRDEVPPEFQELWKRYYESLERAR